MKKNLLCFAASWLLLIGALAALLVTARDLEVTLDVPVVSTETDDDGVTLSWQPVAYATSYRVYSRDSGGQWALVKAVGKDECSYTLTDAAGKEYALRACNICGDKTTLSGYSKAVKTGGAA